MSGRTTRALVIATLALATLSGCSDDQSPQDDFFEQTKVATPPIQNRPACPTDGSTPAVECH